MLCLERYMEKVIDKCSKAQGIIHNVVMHKAQCTIGEVILAE